MQQGTINTRLSRIPFDDTSAMLTSPRISTHTADSKRRQPSLNWTVLTKQRFTPRPLHPGKSAFREPSHWLSHFTLGIISVVENDPLATVVGAYSMLYTGKLIRGIVAFSPCYWFWSLGHSSECRSRSSCPLRTSYLHAEVTSAYQTSTAVNHNINIYFASHGTG